MTDDVVENCLRKATTALESAVNLLSSGLHDDAANRAYYALYHAAEAALIFRGADPTSHRHLQSQFYHHLVQPGFVPASWHKSIIRAFEFRLMGDYSRVSSVSEESVAAVIAEAEEIIPRLAELARSADR
jgi:uncharacterized protein (UPF0332 family)